MIEVNNPVNVFYYVKSSTSPYQAEIVVLGTDASVNITVNSDTLIASALTDLGGLDALIPEDSIADQGAIATADVQHFTASYMSFDNSDDEYHTVMLVQRSGRDYAKVTMRSKIRADLLAAITAIDTAFV